MKIALYARASTTDPNCEMQLREVREYCQRRSWNIYQEYVDTGWAYKATLMHNSSRKPHPLIGRSGPMLDRVAESPRSENRTLLNAACENTVQKRQPF